jgi:hypothetical protein
MKQISIRTELLYILMFSFLSSYAFGNEVAVKIKITQHFVSDSERTLNRNKFDNLNQISAIQIKEREGVWNKLMASQSDLVEMLEVSRNFKDVLSRGMKRIDQLRLFDRLDAYNKLMRNVVVESGNVTSELLMRYALNRGMAAQELFSHERSILKTDMAREALKSLELRVLRDAVNRAIVLYDKDERFLDILKNNSDDTNLAMKSKFGFDMFEVSKLEYERDYANYIIELTANAPTHNGSFQLLKYTVIQLFNGINSTLLRNHSAKLKNILRNLYELGIELPENAPNDPILVQSLNNMTKDNLETIIKDFNEAVDLLKKELAQNDPSIKEEFEKQKKAKALADKLQQERAEVEMAERLRKAAVIADRKKNEKKTKKSTRIIDLPEGQLKKRQEKFKAVFFDQRETKRSISPISQCIAGMEEALKYVSTPDDYISLLQVEVNSPSKDYITAINSFAFSNLKTFTNLNPDIKDFERLTKYVPSISDTIDVKKAALAFVNTRADFKALIEYWISSLGLPNPDYVESMDKFIVESLAYYTQAGATLNDLHKIKSRLIGLNNSIKVMKAGVHLVKNKNDIELWLDPAVDSPNQDYLNAIRALYKESAQTFIDQGLTYAELNSF